MKDATEIRQRRKRVAKPIEVAEHFKTVVSDDMEVTSKALEGRKICVLSDDEDLKKGNLENVIRSHGGIVVQNISKSMRQIYFLKSITSFSFNRYRVTKLH